MKRLLLLLILLTPLSVEACWPVGSTSIPLKKIAFGAIDSGVSTRYTYWAIWTCTTSTGYENFAYMFGAEELAPWLQRVMNGTFSVTEADTACQTLCNVGDYTPAELAFMKPKADQYFAKATVAPINGNLPTRPVYTRLPDGTRKVSAETGQAVAIGDFCDIGNRIATSRYYSVKGDKNVVDGSVLGDVYTECVFFTPLGVY